MEIERLCYNDLEEIHFHSVEWTELTRAGVVTFKLGSGYLLNWRSVYNQLAKRALH
jgi:hypothetical protein